MKALDALHEAQKIAFSPFVFQTAYSMLNLGITDKIFNAKNGLTISEIADATKLNEYGVRVLVEMAEASDILEKDENGRYKLTKIGYFVGRDEMTRVNLMFTQDICYKGLFHLEDAIKNGQPEGLKEIGDWETIYQGLSKLPGRLKTSWFEFDHFYSDNSFDDALKVIFKDQPKMIFDIGGNTGKWAIASTRYNKDVEVTILDLPIQIETAKNNITQNYPDIKDRVNYYPINVLDSQSTIPAGADVYWMSQFLDCFSEAQIESILLKIKENAKPNSKVYIMETFIDNQRFPAAEFSLVATSLYFTVMANGNSKMYSSSVMKYIVDKAGFKCVGEHHLHEDSFHTILELELK
ncbi:MAG: SAM-dependent methyltransferase [Crocinitomicaceae bacterium]|nr:SAM-dependent methyltransferase [Crocinitomicaceae bacterium]